MGYDTNDSHAERKMKSCKVRRPVTPAEEDKILSYLLEGYSPFKISKIVGRDRGCVIRVASKHRKELSDEVQRRMKFSDLQQVDDGLVAYNRYLTSEKRQQVLSEAIDKVQRMMCNPHLAAKDVRDLAVSLGIYIDKFAVETGKTDDNAKSALIAMFQKMEQNVTVIANESSSTSGEASEVYTDEA